MATGGGGGGGGPERTCLCGTVSSSSSCSSTSQQHNSQKSCAKCKICRTKPTKFNFLRGQRSLDLGQQGPTSTGSSNGQSVLSPTSHPTSQKSCKETEATRSGRLQQGRRARSAERYDGLRIQDRTLPAVPRQTSLASPSGSDGPPEYAYPDLPTMSSPPPTYEVAMSKMSHPPTYEEYLKERLKQHQLSTPPPLPPRNPNMPSRSNPSPPPPWSQHSSSNSSTTTTSITTATLQNSFCSCSKCKSAGSMSRSRLAGLRVNLPGDQLVEAQRQLRVALPPEASHQQTVAAAAAAAALATASSSHDQCPCSKCQTLYTAYDVDTTPSCSSNNDDLMFSLDSTTAIQGVMTDGLLCSVM